LEMNDVDKMLADMLASLEEKKRTQSNPNQTKETDFKNNEIHDLLKELKISSGCITEEFVFVNTDKNNPERGFYISNHQVTQEEFQSVMGFNPSWFQKNNLKVNKEQRALIEKLTDTDNHPVEFVSWFDALYYCNKRSIQEHLTPVYRLDDKETDVEKWNYIPCVGKTLENRVFTVNSKADGYRLPTLKEWRIAAKANDAFNYAGSNSIKDVAWYSVNSKNITHQVNQKNPNSLGIYDMSGNVWEWCWDFGDNSHRNIAGGSYNDFCNGCKISFSSCRDAYAQTASIGFRIIRSAIKENI